MGKAPSISKPRSTVPAVAEEAALQKQFFPPNVHDFAFPPCVSDGAQPVRAGLFSPALAALLVEEEACEGKPGSGWVGGVKHRVETQG